MSDQELDRKWAEAEFAAKSDAPRTYDQGRADGRKEAFEAGFKAGRAYEKLLDRIMDGEKDAEYLTEDQAIRRAAAERGIQL